MMKVFSLILLSLFYAGIVNAQTFSNFDTLKNESKDSVVARSSIKNLQEYQAEEFVIKKFNADHWKKLAGKTDFIKKQQNPGKSAQLGELPRLSFESMKILIWIIVIASVVTLIYVVVKKTAWQNKLTKKRSQDVDISEAVADINDLDFTSRLRQAIVNDNYRLAIRIYYLHILQNLNDSGKIVWKKDKTNREYLSELFAKGYFFEEIRKLTLSYEQVWYGEHDVSKDRFNGLSKNFEELQQLIQSEK